MHLMEDEGLNREFHRCQRVFQTNVRTDVTIRALAKLTGSRRIDLVSWLRESKVTNQGYTSNPSFDLIEIHCFSIGRTPD
jgi:phage antirepressor YoqD-like protein